MVFSFAKSRARHKSNSALALGICRAYNENEPGVSVLSERIGYVEYMFGGKLCESGGELGLAMVAYCQPVAMDFNGALCALMALSVFWAVWMG